MAKSYTVLEYLQENIKYAMTSEQWAEKIYNKTTLSFEEANDLIGYLTELNILRLVDFDTFALFSEPLNSFKRLEMLLKKNIISWNGDVF